MLEDLTDITLEVTKLASQVIHLPRGPPLHDAPVLPVELLVVVLVVAELVPEAAGPVVGVVVARRQDRRRRRRRALDRVAQDLLGRLAEVRQRQARVRPVVPAVAVRRRRRRRVAIFCRRGVVVGVHLELLARLLVAALRLLGRVVRVVLVRIKPVILVVIVLGEVLIGNGVQAFHYHPHGALLRARGKALVVL
ncbi:hypothetical protein VM1G_05470 [Cytospora mali]|uniref:Uncharacterized protein n=1 Tax=Cytospora mali TaxID=578113 RepID=A0A194VYJ3_CYTMA|nr:hypothetical protein VM1G_05470 [Valsa mali]